MPADPCLGEPGTLNPKPGFPQNLEPRHICPKPPGKGGFVRLCAEAWGGVIVRVVDCFQSKIHGVTPLTGVTDVGSLYTKHECSIQVSRQSVGSHHYWRHGRGVTVHVTTCEITRVFDSGQSTIHGVTPLTSVTVVGSSYMYRNACSIQVMWAVKAAETANCLKCPKQQKLA